MRDLDAIERDVEILQQRLGRLERLFLVHSKEHAKEPAELIDDHHENIDPHAV